uniref:DNA helicase n=1 Tax=Tanacetum cinerariifolium TaxID=118510 RepID=A0A6L2J796_TANCI|nr:DNA helicase [Tanacetum cinerariifolium]
MGEPGIVGTRGSCSGQVGEGNINQAGLCSAANVVDNVNPTFDVQGFCRMVDTEISGTSLNETRKRSRDTMTTCGNVDGSGCSSSRRQRMSIDYDNPYLTATEADFVLAGGHWKLFSCHVGEGSQPFVVSDSQLGCLTAGVVNGGQAGNINQAATDTDFVLAGGPLPNTRNSSHVHVSGENNPIHESVVSSYTNRKRNGDVTSRTRAPDVGSSFSSTRRCMSSGHYSLNASTSIDDPVFPVDSSNVHVNGSGYSLEHVNPILANEIMPSFPPVGVINSVAIVSVCGFLVSRQECRFNDLHDMIRKRHLHVAMEVQSFLEHRVRSSLKEHLDALNSILMDLKNVEVKIEDEDAALVLLVSLPHVGNGNIGTPDDSDPDNIYWIDIPSEYFIPNDDNEITNLIDFIYDDDTLHHPSVRKFQEKAIICPKNEMADVINTKILSLLTTTTRTYLSYDEATPHGHDGGEVELLYPKEYLNSLSFAGLPPPSGNVIGLTLWHDMALNFNLREYEAMEKPVVIAVSSCWVRQFNGLQLFGTSATHYYLNPNIPETCHIKEQCQQATNTAPILNIDNQRYEDLEQEKNRNRFPLATLLEVDPQNYQVIPEDPIPTCKDHGPQPTPVYRGRVRTISVTCFSDQANSLTKDYNEVLAELPDKNAYRLPPNLKSLEDRVFKETILPLPTPPVQHVPPEPTLTEQPEPIPLAKPLSHALSTTASNEFNPQQDVVGPSQQSPTKSTDLHLRKNKLEENPTDMEPFVA